jgi:hypothetical protein
LNDDARIFIDQDAHRYRILVSLGTVRLPRET